jgi:hypothetical protein
VRGCFGEHGLEGTETPKIEVNADVEGGDDSHVCLKKLLALGRVDNAETFAMPGR